MLKMLQQSRRKNVKTVKTEEKNLNCQNAKKFILSNQTSLNGQNAKNLKLSKCKNVTAVKTQMC